MPCQHLPGSLDKSKEHILSQTEGWCSICKEKGPNLWACLKEGCTFIGCSESKNDHGSAHCEEKKHFVAVNLKTFRVWCYICQQEVHVKEFTSDEMKRLKNSHKSKAVPGMVVTLNEKSGLPQPHTPPIDYLTLTSLQLLHDQTSQGLTGLRNLGNTCYMNAALQSLSNCPQLTNYFMVLGDQPVNGQRSSMARSYSKLLNDLWSEGRHRSVAPSSVHGTLRMVNSSFKGYQQQDTQEFLRCFMDRLHEELKVALPATQLHSPCLEAGDAKTPPHSLTTTMPDSCSDDAVSMTTSTSSDDSYQSCASMQNNDETESMNEDEPMLEDDQYNEELDQLHGSGTPLFRSNSMPSIATNVDGGSKLSVEKTSQRKRTVSSQSSAHINSTLTDIAGLLRSRDKVMKYQSIISDLFDGELRSTVQCKTCNSLSQTRETFQDLSLPIPGKDDMARLHGVSQNLPLLSPASAGPCSNTEDYQTWLYNFWDWLKSWFWGPHVNLVDCLAAFFASDELKGDNMYSCEKCKKLRNGVKFCWLLKLPEVLCIHLKRFRHEYLTSYSTKISSVVTFPLQGLDLGRFMAKDRLSNNTTYDLSSVIVHHGGAGGGHYTSYCKHPLNGNWYEYDDQYVTQVDEATVSAAEAYVLFYRKTDRDAKHFRDCVLSLDYDKQSPILMKFYVAVEWVLEFLTFTEPGPINNHYFLCPHENVQPGMMEDILERVCCVTEQVWAALHKRFGGGPTVTHLQPCGTCIHKAKVLEERRCVERQKYLDLSDCAEDNPSMPTYYISMEWFRRWQNFVNTSQQEPPNKIDNTTIAKLKDGQLILNKASDYGEITCDAWLYLLDTYKGGPAIPNANSFPHDVEAR